MFYFDFPHSTFLISADNFYLEGTDKKVRIHPRCKCLSRHRLTKELEVFDHLLTISGVTDFDSLLETVLNYILFLSFQRRSPPSEA